MERLGNLYARNEVQPDAIRTDLHGCSAGDCWSTHYVDLGTDVESLELVLLDMEDWSKRCRQQPEVTFLVVPARAPEWLDAHRSTCCRCTPSPL
jgi:hypothetical protein